MKELFIIRHAKSSWESDFIKDIDRPLNKRGEKDAPEIGKQLKKRGEIIDQFLSSNAKRAITTARNAAEKFGYPINDIITEDAIYDANVNKLIKIICSIEDKNKSAAIFGHNPGFTELAEYITGELVGNIPTAGIVKIKLEVSSWKEVSSNTGSLVYFIYPKGNTE